ncbi:MAG: 16S rRNA (guanine(527)-N(7))-methyltransferase RsmG [Acidobacteria bacterium]|nr:MAG: 16S rRNA (guanine(527)-N(7))-methyltransferase RsmG [Acidobacteriota bacterium]
MLERNIVRGWLAPFDISLSDEMIDKLLIYLDLLLKWNQKMNLTAIEVPEVCVTRHFGESFFILKATQPSGRLLDIGSGAGFPGLAIRLIAPSLDIALLEPTARKRAFLKEVARACGMDRVGVFDSRLEKFMQTPKQQPFDIITVRAVGGTASLVRKATVLLRNGGSFCLWAGGQQIHQIRDSNPDLHWRNPIPIPLSHDRFILAGVKVHAKS